VSRRGGGMGTVGEAMKGNVCRWKPVPEDW
jgi:hypothetical protein